MEIQRTANAGVLLQLDGSKILLDGLCDRVEQYLPTPDFMVQALLDSPPDILVYTHNHPDHYSKALYAPYESQNLRPILGPESLHYGGVQVGAVTITPVASRHLGKTEPNLAHASYVIQGSRCIWFLGDAAPIQWKNRVDLPKPDVIIAPYPYGSTPMGWDIICSLTSQVVLLHLPNPGEDVYGLRDMVIKTVGNNPKTALYIPEIGETVRIK